MTSDLLTWRVYVPKEREITAFGGNVRRTDEQGSWALGLLGDVTGMLRRAPAGTPVDLARMVEDLEKGSPFQVRSDGTAYLFGNRTGTGSVSLTSVNPTGFLLLRLGLLVGAYVACRLLARALANARLGERIAFLVPFLGILLLLLPSGPGMTAVLTAMLLGVVLSGALSYVGALRDGRARRRAARKAPASGRSAPPPPPATPPPAGGGVA